MAKKLQCGIITFHRAHNYGALLQAYALRKIIASLGYDVKFIDYQHKNLEEGYNLYPKLPSNITTGKFIRYSKDWAHLVLDYRRKKARNIAFNDFINTYIPLIPIERDVSLDVIVLGSDQIWNSKYTSGLDENYYGINKKINSNIKISYAASMGLSSLDKKDEIQFLKYVNSLDHVGVREDSLKNYLISLGKNDVFINLDPTLLLEKKEWTGLSSSASVEVEKPYLLVYQVQEHEATDEIVNYISNELNLRVVVLSARINRHTKKTNITSGSPNDFIYLFNNASYVVTTSFHGTVFSVINEVPFLTLKFSNEIDLRSEFFLKNIGLYSRMLQSQKEVKSVGLDVNFVSSNKKLSLLRLESINYLKEYLGVDYE